MTRLKVRPAWGLAEIALLGGLYVFVVWVIGPRVETSAAALGFYRVTLVIWATTILWLSPIVLHHDPPSLRGWGLGRPRDDPGTLRNAWPTYLAFTAVASLALMLAVAVRQPAFAAQTHWRTVGHKFLIYMVYGPIQALVFFGYVQTRVRAALDPVLGEAWNGRLFVALITAGLFAAAHVPNWPLVALVFTSGVCWSWLYYARPSVLLVGMSHAVLGTIVYTILGLYTRVGPFYAHPETHLALAGVPVLRSLVGDLF